MTGWPGETQLLLLLGVSALIISAALRLSRRLSPGTWIDASIDALLAFYLVQYCAVGVCGVLGCLSGTAILIVGAAAAVLLLPFARPKPPALRVEHGNRWLVAGLVLVLAYIVGLVVQQRLAPPFDNDSLTYHLPAAVTWIQQGRIALFDTWFHNPANTYSPLAGSMFITWLMAPLGNDALARYVQAPALLLVWLGMVRLCRTMGAGALLSAMVATSAVLSRAFLAQATLQKDDLFVAAFFIVAFEGLLRPKDAPLAPWRAGVALGLMLATKYTALLGLPLIALVVHAPFKLGWRKSQLAAVAAIALLLAGGWYLRNWLVTGNPLYPLDLPLLPGLFSTARSEQLRTLSGVWKTLSAGYYSVPAALWVLLGVTWMLTVIKSGFGLLRGPAGLAIILGPVVGIALFLGFSPYGEVRFLYPALLLLWATAAVGSERPIIAGIMLAVSLSTNYILEGQLALLPYVGVVAVVIVAAIAFWRWAPGRMPRLAALGAATLALAAYTFVNWKSYVRQLGTDSVAYWGFPATGYGSLPQAWAFVRDHLPADATLAYANTSFVYPLYGPGLDRRVIYVPPAAKVNHFHDLRPLDRQLTGEQIADAVARHMLRDGDWSARTRRLVESGARYLLVVKRPSLPTDELTAAEGDSRHYRKIFDNDSASIFEIIP